MSLFLDISKVTEQPEAFDRTLDLGDVAGDGSALLDVRDVRLAGRYWKTDRGVELEGRLTAIAGVECGRCLERFEIPVGEAFFLTVVTRGPELRGEIEVTEEDTYLYPAETGRADFREIAREQLFLNLPLKNVCQPDCRGLCPTCGANRNRIECGCRSQDLDPRLAPLLDFRKKPGDH